MPRHREHRRRSAMQHRTNVSDARPAASSGLRSREIRYLVTMGFRVACFLAMIWTPGWGRLVLLAGAVVLPYIAVIGASQVDRRTRLYQVERVGFRSLRTALPDRAADADDGRACAADPSALVLLSHPDEEPTR